MSDTNELNLVIYLEANSVKIGNRKEKWFLGGHGYTFDNKVEGKRKLQKDTPTNRGYFVTERPNTKVVQIEDIVSLLIPNRGSIVTVLGKAVNKLIDKLLEKESNIKSILIITAHKQLDLMSRFTKKKLEKPNVKIGRVELTSEDKKTLTKLIDNLEKVKNLKGSKLLQLDFMGAVEGGLGNKSANKEADIAQVETVWGDSSEILLTFTPRREYENPSTDFNRIVSATRWYFESGDREEFYRLEDGYRVYNFGKVEPDKKYYGKLTPDVTYSRLYTKTPIKNLDKLYEFSGKKVKNPDRYLLAGDLNTVNSKDTLRLLENIPGFIQEGNLVSPITRQNKKPILIEVINPVMLSYKVREGLDVLGLIYDNFKNRKGNKSGYTSYYNITDLIYLKGENKKGEVKVKLQPEFKQDTQIIKTKVEHRNANKPITINLSIGYDLPNRNNFNSINSPEVEVWLALDDRNKLGCRYNCIVTTDDFIYVHTSAVANLRVLALSEIKK